MKTISIKRTALLFLVFLAALYSCKKDNDLEPSNSMQADALEVVEGPPGTVIIVTGSGLAGVESVLFETNEVPAPFNPAFNNNNALVFRVPDTAYGGEQQVIITNRLGRQVQLSFNVIALPSVSSLLPAEFAEGSTLTVRGNNFETVEGVSLESGQPVEVLSASRRELVLQMPASDADKTKLVIRNASGEITYGQDLINIDRALPIFVDAFGAGFESWSWGGNYVASEEQKIMGTHGLQANMTGNSWGALSLHHGAGLNLADYTTVSFWVRGGASEGSFRFMINWAETQTVIVPANVWTRFSFPLSTWKNSGINVLNDIIWQVEGDGQSFYFDNVILSK